MCCDIEANISHHPISLQIQNDHITVGFSLVVGSGTQKLTLTANFKALYLISAAQSESDNAASGFRIVSKGTVEE